MEKVLKVFADVGILLVPHKWLSWEEHNMFGLGLTEIIIFAVILAMLAAPIVIVIAVVIFVMRSQKRSSNNSPNLYRCPDCGGNVSITALTCPHCGRTTKTAS